GRGKMPFLVGGSGLYLQAVIDGYNLTEAQPDQKLRKRLNKKNLDQL
ncbi:MAG: tRNA (adenosine(37)-N6)-dimethylallyltransferase MiaA, partial [Candidatus Komeilibacteria bacterium CG10_big_fil_rev_8_21_14_0_10_41_13]